MKTPKVKFPISILSLLTLLASVILALGVFGSDRPVFQYLGNATGVLLGFLLGAWSQEAEKKRNRKEAVDRFWREFKIFIPQFENRIVLLQSATHAAVFQTVIEYRLPLLEIERFDNDAYSLELDAQLRDELTKLRRTTRILEEYINLGRELEMGARSNFQHILNGLYGEVLSLKDRFK